MDHRDGHLASANDERALPFAVTLPLALTPMLGGGAARAMLAMAPAVMATVSSETRDSGASAILRAEVVCVTAEGAANADELVSKPNDPIESQETEPS